MHIFQLPAGIRGSLRPPAKQADHACAPAVQQTLHRSWPPRAAHPPPTHRRPATPLLPRKSEAVRWL